jgi:TPR repeat protein
MYHMGDMYQHGRNVLVNLLEAKQVYGLAACGEFPQAVLCIL